MSPADRPAASGTVRWLDQLRLADARHFGAKAAVLGELVRLGLPVPRGFAARLGDRGAPTSAEHRAIADAYAELGRRLGAAAPPVAVRSSAAAEDGAHRSFAGQYETCLDVCGADALAAATERVAASRDAARVAVYREAGDDPRGPFAAMAVLVQPMLAPDVSGVCFTRSPLEPDAIELEATRGAAGPLVSGSGVPARVRLARDGLAVRSTRDPGAVLPALGGALERIARLSLRAEEVLGAAADVEWALADGEVWLLQARPVTAAAAPPALASIRRDEIARLRRAAARAARPLAWTDFSLADMLPRPSPLGLEIIARLAGPGGSHVRALRAAGLRACVPDAAGPLYTLICGRAYLNLQAGLEMLDPALPLAVDVDAIAAGDERRPVPPDRVPVRLAWRGPAAALRLLPALPRWLLWVPARFRSLARGLEREFRETAEPAAVAEAERLRRRDLAALADAELWSVLRGFLDRFVELHYYHQAADTLAFPTHALLRGILTRLYGAEAEAAFLRLTTGLPGNFNTETNLDLARVAAGELGFDACLERYGHRGFPDYEVSAPRWRERPDRVRAMADAIARSDTDPRARFEHQRELRSRAEARLARDLRARRSLRPWRRAVLALLDTYQRYSTLREPTQALCFRYVELLRRALLEADRRSGGAERVFFASLGEVEALLTERANPEEIWGRAGHRREVLRQARRLPVPHVVVSTDPEALGRPPALEGDGPELTGEPVSGGVVRGRARVVEGLDEAQGLAAGEILVAAHADPSWTPLFLVAAGLVLEQGGMLSHPAIVAREYGLPAIVNASQATRRIRTGDRLLLDANRGRVVVETGGAGGSARRHTEDA